MKMKRFVIIVVVLALLPATISVDAAILPATLPWTSTRVDGDFISGLGTYVSLAHDPITGKAFISYYEDFNQDLRIAYQVHSGSGNCGTTNDWVCEIVDSTGAVGRYSSIDVTHVQAANPSVSYLKIGISYFDDTNDALKYAEAIFTTFPTWTIDVIEDSPGNASFGEYSSLKFTSDHKPRIAYHYSLNLTPSLGAVKLAWFIGDSSGNCGSGNNWRCDLVDGKNNHPNYGTHVSLDLDYQDSVRIAYYDPVEGDLYYAYLIMYVNDSCMNPAWACNIIDHVGDVGRFVSIHAPKSGSDYLQFAYFDATEKEVRYAYPEPGHGFVSFAVDNTGNIPGDMGLSLAVDTQGYPIIAYMNTESYGNGSDLKIARPATVYGRDAGNCGDLKPYSMLPYQYWFCETIASGGEISKLAEYAALSIDPSGLAAVAYFMADMSGRLMIARQWYAIFLPIIEN